MKKDKEALICDLAETYQIYDYRRLPCYTVAVLASGLRDNSRIKSKINGLLVPLDTFMSALEVDALNTLVWMQTKDGRKGSNRPAKLSSALQIKKEQKRKFKVTTKEAFAERYKRLYGRSI